MCKEKKKNKIGRRILSVTLTFVMALTLVPTYAVQAETPVADTVQAEKEIITEKVATKDVVYSATPNSPIKLKELQEIDLSASVSGNPDATVKLTAEDIDATDLSGWYVYDHYDKEWYANEATYAEETGYNTSRRPYYQVDDSYANGAGEGKKTIAQWIEANKNSSYPQLNRLNEHIMSEADSAGNASMTFVGYSALPLADFLFYPSDISGTKTVDYSVDASAVNAHTLSYAGFLFNAGLDEDGRLQAYAFLIKYQENSSPAKITEIGIYKVDTAPNTLHASAATIGQSSQAVKTITDSTTLASLNGDGFKKADVHMEITQNSVKITMKEANVTSNAQEVTLFDLKSGSGKTISPTGFGGFGPIVGYTSHGCSAATIYKYSNLKMKVKNVASLFAAYFDADYAQKDKTSTNNSTGNNNKYYIVIGDPEKDFFDITQDKEALALLQNENVVLITNLDITRSNVGTGLESKPNYSVGDYIGTDNVKHFAPSSNSIALNSPAYFNELKQFIQNTVTNVSWTQIGTTETGNISALGHYTDGSYLETVSAVASTPNTWLSYTTNSEDESGHVTYQVANINADMLDALPNNKAVIKIENDLSYGSDAVTYSIIKPDGEEEVLESNTFAVTDDVEEWPAGQYKVVTKFANGMEAASTFGLTNGLDVYIVGGETKTNLWFDYATVGKNVARSYCDYETKIHAKDGFVIPDSVCVYVNKDRINSSDLADFDFLDSSQYSYNPKSGVLRITGENVTGDIYIKADTRNITYNLSTDPSTSSSKLEVFGSSSYAVDAMGCFSSYYKTDSKYYYAYFKPSNGYGYPLTEDVKIEAYVYNRNDQTGEIIYNAGQPEIDDSKTVTFIGANYYTEDTGRLKFPKNAFAYDELVVTAQAKPKILKVTKKFQAVNNTNTKISSIIEAKKDSTFAEVADTKVVWHNAYECVLKVKDGEGYEAYKIDPNSITLKMGGVTFNGWTKKAGENGTYTIHINENVIENNIEITANAVRYYKVIGELGGVTSTTSLPTTGVDWAPHTNYTTTLTIDGSNDHPLAQLVSVAIKNTQNDNYTVLSKDGEDPDYSYDPTTGALVINQEAITNDIKVTASAGNRIYYELDNMHATPEVKGVADGATLNTTLKVDNDAYKLPDDITVYQGDVMLSSGYEYDPIEGTLKVVGITAPVVIRAKAVLKPVDVTLDNATTCGLTLTDETNKKASADADYHANLSVNDTSEKKLPETIIVKVADPTATGGTRTLTAETDYTYNPTTGKIVVKHQNITGDIVITAVAEDKTKYDVTANIVNATVTVSGNNVAAEGKNFVTKVTPNTYYELPSEVTIVVADGSANGKTLVAGDDYTYATDGKITVFANSIVGDITITGEATKANFPLTRNYTKVTGRTLSGTVSKGADFYDRIKLVTGDDDLLMPSKVEITVDGVALSEDDYGYSSSNGVITIEGNKITGPVVITASAEYKLKFELKGGLKPRESEDETIDTSEDYKTKLEVEDDEQYKLPTTIVVKVDGQPLAQPDDYTYDPTTGQVVIKKDKITGPVVIEAQPDRKVADEGTKCSITEVDEQGDDVDDALVEYGKDYVAVIEPDEGYLLPETIVVKSGDTVLEEGTDYTYDKETGKVVVKSDKVDGKLIIKAVAVPKQFDVDTTGVKKAEVTNKEKATFDQDYETTIKPNKGYALPDSITVTVGDTVLGEGYTYDPTTGDVVIDKSKVTDDIAIAADMKVLKNDIVLKTSNLSSDAKETVETDNEYKVIVKPANDKYELPDTIEVKVDGKALEAGKDYTFDKKTGQVVINKDVINGNVEITAAAVPIHVLTKVPAKAATCTTDGNTEYYTCSKCSDLFADADATKKIDKAATVVKAEGHKWGDWSVDESGKTRSHVCTVCGEKEQEAYDGSKANALALNAGLKVDQVGKKIKLAWGKVDDADGYMLYWTYCGTKFSNRNRKTVKSPSITTYTIKKVNGKKLNLKKNFKLYVVAYKNVDGKKQTIGKTVTAHIVGRKNIDYTNVKEVKVSKKTMTLGVDKTEKIKAKTVLVDKSKKQLTDEHAKEFRYASTDDNVATVNAKGVVTGKSKGTCKVYVYARNGYAKAITVTVK